MLRKFLATAYLAALVVLGIAIGDALTPKPVAAMPINICPPSKGQLFIDDENPAVNFYTSVDCRPAQGWSCQWYVYYDLYLKNVQTGQYGHVGGWYMDFNGHCNQLDSGSQLVTLWSGDFYIDAYLFDYEGDLLNRAQKYMSVP